VTGLEVEVIVSERLVTGLEVMVSNGFVTVLVMG